ncbi:MAG: tRNA (guanosine(37)-N1)-methyltransferase TrmD [Propionibacteriaceae bacterium]|nr:tRNA (guanosine(37)-N1)-methyltransferase TrmD [Propionibacteriaceae bacterium]
MQIDVVTIFGEYFSPLSLSLVGKAIESGVVQLAVHDLRTWTHDRHRSVDDAPYGGGAGMVMKPEPWGEALDALSFESDTPPVLIVPTPSGRRFTQRMAQEFANQSRLIFACGRYEGIDQRVVEYAKTNFQVHEVSLGDYVLSGGEVAAIAIIEAVARLLPGVLGNPESLLEESHAEGLSEMLEYPVYTRPATWRGLDVPQVLLSGNHAEISQWRHEQARQRTSRRGS